ncbi:aminotransferase class V-fold PLP-dependent enzyme [Halomarina oriensis]|uniref:Aminotransferase class V-fold PLP-dependent enzyme n=1 Tax=Halomarina oriensis TaxID=671145 RepID=A0A6B0GJB8_9EURY|nr:aminotransferase class V-fold PLP-dependent enzyme [Halomarina oriensis]
MTPEDLRAAIPAFDDGIYFNAGASGPSPEPVLDATCDAVRSHEVDAPTGAGCYPVAFDAFERYRERFADFLGADRAELALTSSTADGIARVAASVDWEPGDVVVRTDLEHPAGILPWWNLREQGVEVRVLETEDGRVDREAYAEAVADARLVCFNSITWTHGTRWPVADLVEAAHDHGTEVLVDAVQSVGQTDLDCGAWDAEYVVGACHKWLLGPWGAGFLFVREDVDTSPAQVGYRSVTDAMDETPELKPGAARFEVGTTNVGPYAGATAAMDLHEELGTETVEGRITDLAERLAAGLDDRVVGPATPESGLVAFSTGDEDPDALVERLEAEGLYVRSLPSGAVRASVHAYNTEGDVDTLLDAL